MCVSIICELCKLYIIKRCFQNKGYFVYLTHWFYSYSSFQQLNSKIVAKVNTFFEINKKK